MAHFHQLLDEVPEGESEARRAVALLNTIIDMLPVGVTVQSEDGTVLLANETAAGFRGAADPAVGASAATAAVSQLTREADPGPPSRRASTVTEERIIGIAGERTLLTCRRPVRILDRPLLLSAALDFTERKQAELELSKRAYFDDLTGLPNGALIQDHVERLTRTGPHTRFALALLDIDNFKHINDYYTHALGDALLVKMAQRIAAHIRPSDFLGRISGDEFLLVLNPLGRADTLAELVNNLLQQIRQPFLIEGFEIMTSASVGVSVHPDHGVNYEMLRRSADTAMDQVKTNAKGGAAFFDGEMARAMTVRTAQEQRLRLGIRDGRFCCAFQPKLDMRTLEVVGVEALIRLRDEDGEIQGPAEFIGLAIDLGLIDDLTHLALGEIVRSMDLLNDAFGPQTPISVNVAARQAGDVKFMTSFCQELKATDCPSRFMVEVTEEAFLAKNSFQAEVLPMLRALGTRVSVDDFGSGYSSLATLADITADEIKIDRSFITGIHQRPRSQSVLKAIEALSEALGMTIIAEGVETFEEAAYLQATTRIRFAQGYYFAKPMLLQDLTPAPRVIDAARSSPQSRERSPLRGQRTAGR
ncbi:MAG TPA: EAL domain-containing protein [Xanthobacteraceae bacterium]|nr:EAL domain-containing protein [Xanthobacteraceae bacterium]